MSDAIETDGGTLTFERKPARRKYQRRTLGSRVARSRATPARERAPRRSLEIEPGAVYEAVGGIVVLTDAGVAMVPRLFDEKWSERWTAEDRLNGTEIGLLTKALGDEALTNATFAAWLTKIGRQQTHVALTRALLIIAIPRLARRGMLPPDLMEALSGAGAEFATTINPEASVSVETGGTHDVDGGYGVGEINSGEVPDGNTPLRSDPPFETGQSEVPSAESTNGTTGHAVPKSRKDRVSAGA